MRPHTPFSAVLLSMVLLVAVSSAIPARAEPRELLQAYETLREARADVRTGIATWKQQGHQAEADQADKLEYSEALIDRVHRAHRDGVLPREIYLRLLEQRHRLNDIAATEFRTRRALNQRMKVNARKSMVLSRVPLIRWFKRGWVYTPKRAAQALADSDEVQGAREDFTELQTEIEDVLEAAAPEDELICDDAERKALLAHINGLNKKWADRWCTPQRWSGCGAPALHEANGLRASVANARTKPQCDWVRRMASCKSGCMMSHIGDGGAAQWRDCMDNCSLYLPYPE